MENANNAHDFDTIELLSGAIEGTRYATEVSAVLLEWKLIYPPNYIRYIVSQRKNVYNEQIWNAIAEVVKRRKERREKNAELAKKLVA
ncbi:hypothetical protein GCM10028807_09750 [Spirosoma daeguense]